MSSNNDFSNKAKRDFDLVQLAQKGNQMAYSKLLRYYRDPLFYMMKKMVSNDNDAEDLTIEAISKAFKMIDEYTPKFAFSTWLYKIATNHCIDFIRKQNKYNTLSIDENFENSNNNKTILIKSQTPDPEEKMIEGQKGKFLKSIISNLNPDYQEIIRLKYYDGLSYIEIAEKLNIPLGTVKARLYRSKDFLLSILNNNDIII